MDVLWKISDILQPYKDEVSLGASVITILQLLSPALLVNDIRKAKSAENFPIGPFLGGFIL
jgi:solute carrier family 50 (sugar transporter)